MYTRFFSVLFFLTLVNVPLIAQDNKLFMPLEIQQAYEKGTRSWDGSPGPNYWQNMVDYDIDVQVDPSTRAITGSENVTFYNNSPDSLSALVVRLYYDVFREGNPRAMRVDPEDLGEVELSNLTINGQAYELDGRRVRKTGTNLIISLNEPLAPNQSLEMSTDWEQKVPLTLRRTGAIDSTSFFIAYWYPQVAAYDDVFGWDVMDYSLRTEFYNNLGNFDVRITVPENFTVWSTGMLQNPEEVLPDNILSKYEEARNSEETIGVVTLEDLENGLSYKSGTWHFQAAEVTDFAFAMSDHYLWTAAMQEVEDRKVLISSAFPADNAAAYAELTSIQQKTMKHFSEDIPGIPYPYPAFTTFIGLRGGGMEFPMMANNDGPGRGVTIHELFHTYFPMYVRVNERRFAWMDEGWANYITELVSERFFDGVDEPVFIGPKMSIQNIFGSYSDLPLITSTQYMDNTNYGYASYPLPQFVYSVLHHYLGEETFMEAFRTYIRRWAYKSPTPYDFFFTFEDVSGEDLDWFWEPWFFRFGYADVEVEEFENGQLTVSNRGKRPVPLTVDITYQNGDREQLIENAKIWVDHDNYSLDIPRAEEVQYFIVNRQIPDVDEMNNFYPSLDKVYASMDIDQEIVGSYQVNEFPLTAEISMKDGALYMNIPRAGLEAYLLPLGDERYESLDSGVQLQFDKEDGKYSGLSMSVMGQTITAQKQ
ncbi:MAG: M1 family metallopeptidase [Cyclobacteriaceae bacterium]